MGAVRDRSQIIMDKAKRNELNHFDVDLTKLTDVVAFVSGLIKVGFTTTKHVERCVITRL